MQVCGDSRLCPVDLIAQLFEPGKHGDGLAEDVDRLLSALVKDMSAGKAATEAARQTGLPRRDLYQRLIDLKGGDAE